MRRSLSIVAILAVSSAAPHAAPVDPCQRVVATGTFAEVAVPGVDVTYVSGINSRGQIVGTYTAGGVTSGFLLDRAEYIAVNIAGSTTTRATDINSQGVIVGSYDDATGSHGFIWNDGVVVTLDVPGAIATSPNGINDAGTVVGLINTPGGIDGIERGFVYRDGEFRIIDYPNASGTTLLDINNADTALGGYVNLTPAYFLYKNGAFTAVPVCDPSYTVLNEITNRGDLIGSSQTANNASMGTVATRRGLELVHPANATRSVLVAGNAAGVVVGLYWDLAGYQHSFVFVPH